MHSAFSHLLGCLGESTPVGKIDASSVGRFKRYLGERLKTSTCNKVITIVRALWNRARKARLIRGDNPWSGVRVGREIPHDQRALRDDELQSLYDAAAEQGDQWHVLVLVLAGSGLRIGEAEYLRWVDVDLEAGTLTVSPRGRSLVEIGGRSYHLPTWTAKATASYRTVPVPGWIIDSLRRWKARNGASPYVFVTLDRLAVISARVEQGRWRDNEHPLSRTGHKVLGRIHQRARKLLASRRGVPEGKLAWDRLGFHDLRRSYLTRLANSNVPAHVLKRVGGHETLATTMAYYLKPTDDDSARILAALGDSRTVQGTTREQGTTDVA
jgi:integrase